VHLDHHPGQNRDRLILLAGHGAAQVGLLDVEKLLMADDLVLQVVGVEVFSGLRLQLS
jgi:hypothetical protein